MKQCKKCKNNIPARIVIDGKIRSLQRRSFCLECSPFGSHNTSDITKPKLSRQRYYRWQKKERARRKKALVELLGGKCIYCGYCKSYRAMEFDHRNPEQKRFSISGNILRLWATVLEEAEKCNLVCANCHRERHEL